MIVSTFFAHAIRDLQVPDSPLIYQERFGLINRAVGVTAGVFAGLLSKHYLEQDTVNIVSNQVDLSSLSIMKAGKEIGITVASDAVRRGFLHPVGPEVFKSWNPSNFHNKNLGVFLYHHNTLTVRFGTEVVPPASVEVWYTRLPTGVENDSDNIDLPEGAPTELAILKTKQFIVERVGKEQNFSDEIRVLIRQLYEQFEFLADKRELEKHIQAFV